MKKFAIFCSAMALLGLASCDDKSDLGVEQKNPQEPVLAVGNVSVVPQAPFTGAAINVANMPANDKINVLTCKTKEALPAGTKLWFDIELAGDNTFAKSTTINLTPGATKGDPYYMTAGELNDAVYELFGKAPLARDVFYRVAAYYLVGDELLRVREGNQEAWLMANHIQVTPVDLQLVEGEYYIMTSLTGMNLSSAIKLNHSDKHHYDDPIFISEPIEVTASDVASNNISWAIVSKTAMETGNTGLVYGAADGADVTAMTGDLVEGGAYLELAAPAKYQIRVNMLDKTYEVGFANDQLYVWTPMLQFKSLMGLTTNDYLTYNGVAFLPGLWKLTGEANMLGLQIGKGATEGSLQFGKTTTPIAVPAEGANKLYFMEANLAEMTYATTCIESLGIVGGNNNWGNETNGVVTPDALMTDAGGNHNVWKGTVTFADAGNLEFKIRMNNAWTINYGLQEDLGNGVYYVGYNYGTNLSVPETGTYEITIDFAVRIETVNGSPKPMPYKLTVVKQ